MVQHVTFVGNAAANPELRFAQSGVASVRLSMICQDRYRDAHGEWADGPPHTVFVTAFRDAAERISASVTKGDRIVVVGSFSSRRVEQEDGTGKWYTDFIADEVALSTRFAEVSSRRVRGHKSSPADAATPAPAGDPWSVPQDVPQTV